MSKFYLLSWFIHLWVNIVTSSHSVFIVMVKFNLSSLKWLQRTTFHQPYLSGAVEAVASELWTKKNNPYLDTTNAIECCLLRSFCAPHRRCRVAPCRAIVKRTVRFHYLLEYFHSRLDLLHCLFHLGVSLFRKGADTISVHYTNSGYAFAGMSLAVTLLIL